MHTRPILLLFVYGCLVLQTAVGQPAGTQEPDNKKAFSGLQGTSVTDLSLLLTGGLRNPFLGLTLNVIWPQRNGYYWGASVTQGFDVLELESGSIGILMGRGGTSARLTGGIRFSEVEKTDIDAVTTVPDGDGNTAEVLCEPVEIPYIQSRFLLLDVWLEETGRYSRTEVDPVTGQEYAAFEPGYSVLLVPKLRYLRETDYRYATANYVFRDKRVEWVEFGPVISFDLSKFGGWVQYVLISQDIFVLEGGLGIVVNNAVPPYKTGINGGLEKTTFFDSIYVPFQLSAGVRVKL